MESASLSSSPNCGSTFSKYHLKYSTEISDIVHTILRFGGLPALALPCLTTIPPKLSHSGFLGLCIKSVVFNIEVSLVLNP